MKALTRLIAASLFVLCAAPALAGTPLQLWHCEVEDGASEDDVLNAVEDWLEDVKEVPGGENLQVQVMFPIVVASEGDYDVWLALSADSFETWGKFWDNYPSSDAGELEDEQSEIYVCPDSVLFEATAPDAD